MYLSRGIIHAVILKLLLIQLVSSKIVNFEVGEIYYEYDNESKPLGIGASGIVYKGIRKEGNQIEDVAFKEEMRKVTRKSWDKEREIYERIGPHEQIPKFYHYFPETNQTKAVFVTQLLGITLPNLWQSKSDQFSSVTILKIGLQVLDVFEYIHKKGVMHRDLHIGNLALGYKNDSKIYLFDFDMSTTIENYKSSDEFYRRVKKQEMPTFSFLLMRMARFDEWNEGNVNERDCVGACWKINDEISVDTELNYDNLRKILRSELEKHRHEPNSDKFDWEISHT